MNESCEDGGTSDTNINLEGDFKVENLFFSELGDPLEEGVCLPMGSGERGLRKNSRKVQAFYLQMLHLSQQVSNWRGRQSSVNSENYAGKHCQ